MEEMAVELKTVPSGKNIDEFPNSCSSVVSDRSMESLLVAEYPQGRQGFPRIERGVGDCAEDENSSVNLEMETAPSQNDEACSKVFKKIIGDGGVTFLRPILVLSANPY
jgi:hypothetical protein